MTDGPISNFEVTDCDLMGRRGILKVNGRKVETPELMPVVNPNKMGRADSIEPKELMDRFRFKMIITNSYIIRRSEDLRDRIVSEGLHRSLSFDGVIMTDSGTFQSYMYGGGKDEVEVGPLEIIEFQNSIGSDIGTILDRFTVPDSDHDDAENDLTITMERARDSLKASKNMEVAVPVQGGRHLDLRQTSGRLVKEAGVSYAPIGGVVPIMESYDYPLLVDVIASAKKGLGPAIPSHLFGAGHPMILPLAVAMGCDLFDSASYIKFATDGRYMTRTRTHHLRELETFPCSCPVCSKYGPPDLLSMPADERTGNLARHNLSVLRNVLDDIRNSISEGTLWEMVERSAMSNPQMYAAVRRMRDHTSLIEEQAPRSTRRFMCSSSLSLARPEFQRHEEKIGVMMRGDGKPLILDDWKRNYSRMVSDLMGNPPVGMDPYVNSPIGPFPYELNDMYPLGQAIFPPVEGLDEGLREHMEKMWERMDLGDGIVWHGREIPEDLPRRIGVVEGNRRRIIQLIRYQFSNDLGIDPVVALFGAVDDPGDRMDLVVSRKTGKVRNIRVVEDGERKHLLSLRAEDGQFSIKIEGARRLHSSIVFPWLRVVVDNETGEYNAKGLNVFNKFIKDADRSIRPGDDVLVVNEDDDLLAVGKAQAGWQFLIDSRSGIGVKVREGVNTSGNGKDNS